MIAARPCSATCVVEGVPIVVRFYPDSGALRLTDAAGRCLRESRWADTWRSLMTALNGLDSKSVDPNVVLRIMVEDLLDCARTEAADAASRSSGTTDAA
jgi:hypothetical protein